MADRVVVKHDPDARLVVFHQPMQVRLLFGAIGTLVVSEFDDSYGRESVTTHVLAR
jgi:hypothetical protein